MRGLAPGRLERLVAAARALSDPSRVEILRLVYAQPAPVCACDVVERFDLSQPTVSHHLGVLREAGLLKSSRIGIWSFYEPDPEAARIVSEIGDLLTPAPRAAG